MNKKTMIMAGLGVVALAITGGSIYFFFPAILPSSITGLPLAAAAAKHAKEEKLHTPEASADLDVFVVNLAGQQAARYLRTTLSLGLPSEKEKEELKELNGPIRHAIIMYLTERHVEELADPQGKTKVRGDLLKEINKAIGKNIVSNVYFKEFLIQ